MDPNNFAEMKDLKLCESSSCTDLPGLVDDSGSSNDEDENASSGDEEEVLEEKEKEIPRKVLTVDMVNEGIKVMTYAVRGPLLIRANEIEQEINKGVKKSFDSVIKANIGDAHAMGNRPITFIRQVMALVTCPSMLESNLFPEDVRSRARELLTGCRGGSVGSYSDSPGIPCIRKHVADYIEKRDGGIPADWRNIMLSAGASEAIRAILKLMTNPGSITHKKKTGVMIPIPQYPLYSATLAEYGMDKVGYYLAEEKNWALEQAELERAIREAKKKCAVRAIVVINPGNPTGQVLNRANIESIIRFAHKERLFILADEVYQHNVYTRDSEFHSFKKVMMEMGAPYNTLELVSFMSCSKGYMGECGIRGGYAEILNMDHDVMGMLQKSISAKLCPPVLGQACMDLVVNPPAADEPSYTIWQTEVNSVMDSLARRAVLVATTLNSIPGFICNVVQGAMYAFPRILLPDRAIAAAKEAGQPPDVFYAFALLEATGICVIPGSGFGQKPGTFHFRTTILPQEEVIIDMLERLKQFHCKFMQDYA